MGARSMGQEDFNRLCPWAQLKAHETRIEHNESALPLKADCESASNLDPTPIESQIVEAVAELLTLSAFDRLPTVTPLFS